MFGKKPIEQSGILDNILSNLLSRYGITQTHIDKIKNILDHLEITDTEIKINLNKIKIVIDKSD